MIFGCLTLLFILVLAVSEGSQETTGGRIAAAVFFGVFALASLAGLIAGLVRTSRMEIGRDVIVHRPVASRRAPRRPSASTPQTRVFTFPRHEGDTLRLLPKFTFYARARKPKLIFLGRGGFIPLNGYSPARVQRACEAQGWRFDGNPALAVKDVQDWLHSGLSLDAVQLLMTLGRSPQRRRTTSRKPAWRPRFIRSRLAPRRHRVKPVPLGVLRSIGFSSARSQACEMAR